MTSLPLARVFQCLFTFAFVSASRWLGEIWRLSRRGATGELEVEFKFHRCSCKLSFLFSPPLPDPLAWRACSQVNDSPIVLYPTAINREEVITSRSHGSKLSGWQQTVSVTRKSEFALFKTSWILFNFIQFVKRWRNYFSGIESERTASKVGKRKRKFLCCAHWLHKAEKHAHEIRKFYVAIVQLRLQKSLIHLQSSCFANINLLL